MSHAKPAPKKSVARRRFDDAFKQEAVALAEKIGFRQAATDLDVNEGNLRTWSKAIAAHGDLAFAKRSERAQVDATAELKELRERVRVLEMERDILKKATAFFAKDAE